MSRRSDFQAGKPIPAGMIYFTPDSAKGNNGPQGFAVISGGRYDTRREGRATVPGPSIVSIAGNDGSRGKGMAIPLFDDYSQPADILAGGYASQNFKASRRTPPEDPGGLRSAKSDVTLPSPGTRLCESPWVFFWATIPTGTRRLVPGLAVIAP